MCEKTRTELENLPTAPGKMTNGAKKGFKLIMKEIENVDRRIGKLSEQVLSVDSKVEKFGDRLSTMERATASVLEQVTEMHKKLEVNNIEEKAAVMDSLQRFVGSKFGKILLIFFLICGGLSVAYIVEHSTAAVPIIQAVK